MPENGRNNNFNLLRLVLATLVILGHSPELIDGNRSRELLTSVFHTLSLGDFAVGGFFILSGFLIVQSWERQPKFKPYFEKRLLRIYPGYLVAGLIAAFIIGPLGSEGVGQYFAQFNYPRYFFFLLLLLGVATPPVFGHWPYPILNGSLWTIAHEFRCYIIVALLGKAGIVQRRKVLLAVTAIILTLSTMPSLLDKLTFRGAWYLVGEIPAFFRLLALFLAGSCFYMFRDFIKYKSSFALVSLLILVLCFFRPWSAQIALATVGAYLFFFVAFAKIPALDFFKKCSDISYGVYLYGWPSQKLILWYLPHISPWLLFVLACIPSYILGYLSWHIVESPMLRLKPRAQARVTAT